jgi:alpha-L-fucosidase
MRTASNIALFLILALATLSYTQQTAQNARMIKVEDTDTPEDVLRKSTRVVPTPQQYAWQCNEFLAFIHFGVNSFTGREWGTGMEDPAVFNPTDCDPEQWVKIMKDAGMRGAVITVKHHDGFCLWPSRYTRHSVKNSPWLNGKGDVLALLAAACRKHGLKLGIYLSPADLNQIESAEGNYGNGSKAHTCKIPSDPQHQRTAKQVFEYEDLTDYDVYFMNQLYEVLTEYGDIFEVWFDGANPKPGTGQTYNRQAWYDMIRTLQPDAVIAIDGPDVRWCGNEAGRTRKNEWSVMALTGHPDDKGSYPKYNAEDMGSRARFPDTKYFYWKPAETNTTTRHGWFYRDEKQHVKPASELIDVWFRSIGGNSVFLLNLNPDNRGLIPDRDAAVLRELGQVTKDTFKHNLVQHARARASNSQGNYTAKNIVDGNPDSYWMPEEGQERADIVVDLKDRQAFNCLVLQEAIRTRGQRVEAFAIDIWEDQAWKKVTEGTVIGYKSIKRFPLVTASKLRIRILASRLCPTLSFFGLYRGEGSD